MAHVELMRLRRDTWWDRIKRSITLGPYNPKDAALARLFGGGRGSAGVSVNEATAMNYSAVWAAVGLISGDIARVPLMFYKRTADGRGKDRFTQHPLYRLLHDRPNPEMGSMIFRRTLQAHALVWGNGYAEIERDVAGRPVALWPLLPYAVETFLEAGRLQYRIHNPTQPPIVLNPNQILHLRGLMMDDGRVGLPCVGSARESMGLGIAAERFGATFFGNGSTFGGIISYPETVRADEQVRKDNRKAIEAAHQGVDRAHRFLALYEGAKYQSLGVPPDAAQFLETREFQIEEVCRWFNLPPHKLKHLKRSTNNNIEHQGIEYKTDTLDPWWSLWEEELTLKLIAPLELNLQVIEHVREGLLQGDQAGRGEFYSKRFSVASITPNEVRASENANPLPGGDRAFVPLNLIPLDRLDEWLDAEIASKKAKAEPPPEPPKKPDEDMSDDEEMMAARQRAQAAEEAADFARHELQREREAHEATRTAAAEQAQSQAERVEALDRAVIAGQSRQLALEADVRRLDEARLAAEADTAAALLAVDGAHEARDAAERERQAASERARLADEARTVAETSRDVALAVVADIEQQRDAALADAELGRAELVTLEAAATELRGMLAVTGAHDEAMTAQCQALTTERDTLAVAVAESRAELSAAQEQQRTQRSVVLAAMRSLFVDATERVLQREMDRARKHQTTPEKLRSWVETFYPLHADICRQAFRPLVGPWTAMTGGAPSELLERLVTGHVETSTRALRQVAESDDPEAMAAALERTLRRWEEERGDAVADELMREGMAGQ